MSDKTLLKITCPQLPRTIELLRQLNANTSIAVGRGLRGWAEETRRRALRVTPKKLGALRNSIYIEQNKETPSRIIIGAGGVAGQGNVVKSTNKEYVGYAVIVHEKMFDNYSTGGTASKYLENPIEERKFEIDDNISTELEKELAKLAKT